ncbi:MAG TPA: hypothetical protein VJM31_15105 [Vicinamibacterales bacterium]|nr:hypothetical protein [Vicinamibacterales bacterium]
MRLATQTDSSFIALRPFSTLSLLPPQSLLSSSASLIVDPALTFIATRVVRLEEYYELAWANPEEVALLSSITIGADPDWGKVHLFPVRWPVLVADEGQDLSEKRTLGRCGSFLKKRLTSLHGTQRALVPWEENPAFLAGRPYQINANIRIGRETQAGLLSLIDVNDHLMVRGLSHLLKTAMLKCMSRTFVDTACMELYVAMEATLEIILRKLRANGLRNPSNKDASDYLLQAVGASHRLDRYYEQYYEDRIKALHPNSRFGPASFTPLYVDDLYMLYDDLLGTIEFLITGSSRRHQGHRH